MHSNIKEKKTPKENLHFHRVQLWTLKYINAN